MKKKIALIILMLGLPIALLLTNFGYSLYKFNEPENKMSKGTCLETFSVEHWHKHSPPTTSVHSVVRNNMQVYIVDGNCYKNTKTIPWEQEHEFMYFIAVCTGILLALIGGVIAIVFVIFWFVAIHTVCVIKPDEKFIDRFWQSFE
jgi:hypothetical protein